MTEDQGNIVDFGLVEHMDRTGTPCAYCGKPSVQTLVVAPSPGAGRPDVRVGLCADHRREPELPVGDPRRKTDKTHKQERWPI